MESLVLTDESLSNVSISSHRGFPDKFGSARMKTYLGGPVEIGIGTAICNEFEKEDALRRLCMSCVFITMKCLEVN